MNRLKEIREARGILQTEMADILKVSQATYSNWERGRHHITQEALIFLSNFFDCSIDYILSNSTNRNESVAIEEKTKISAADQVYFRIAQDAKEAGISPEDMRMALEFIKRAKERD